MCFGNTQTQQQQNTYTPNPYVGSAAEQNITAAQNLQNAGYTPYTGQRVADFTGLQNEGFNLAGAVGGQPVNPWQNQEAADYTAYGSAPAASVSPSTIASAMDPYMNQYVQQALAPQLQMQQQQFAQQNQALNAQATGEGAFGDARAGVQGANLTQQQDIAQQGLLGQAYTNAFNTAIGAGAQDVANSLSAQTTNAGLYEQQLQRLLGSGQNLSTLYPQNLSNYTNLINLLQGQGGLQQQQAQSLLNVPYSNYLAAQQYPFLTSQNLNAAIGTGAQAMPASSTQTTTQPNNAGWALAGAVAPSLFNGGTGGFANSAMGGLTSGIGGLLGSGGTAGALGSGALDASSLLLFSDERLKEDVAKIGELYDGTNVYKFRYKGDKSKRVHVGVIAQEVEQDHPEAVHEVAGYKAVDYDKLTNLAAAIGEAA